MILSHVNGRIPVIAAGSIKTRDDALKAIELGLSLAAIGQALVINPNWMDLAVKGEPIEEALSISKRAELAVPEKLWIVIDAAKGWFKVTA